MGKVIGLFLAFVLGAWLLNGAPAPAQPAAPAYPPPGAYGGQDVLVNDYAADPYPRVTQAETFIGVHGSTVVVHYKSSTAAPSGYSGVAYSTNGGATFTEIRPSPFNSGHGTNFSDPTVVYSVRLGLWFASNLAGDCGGQGIGLWTSPDAVNWTPGVCAHYGTEDDRQSHWVDNNPASPYYGAQYISWTSLDMGGLLFVTVSYDGVTWRPPVALSLGVLRNVQLTGSRGPDGTVFVVAMDEGGGGFAPRTNRLFRSTDGGQTWTQHAMGPAFPAPGASLCPGGYFPRIEPIWRTMGWGQPGAGPNGVVHYAYTGGNTGNGDAGDILYTRSTDNGATWAAAIRLNTDPTTREQWLPSLAVTERGEVVVSWYDRRGTINYDYEYWGRVSTDNGATWEPDGPISDRVIPQPLQPDPLLPACFAGDYNYHVADATTAYLAWTDGRNLVNGSPQQDIYFDRVVFGPPPPSPTPSATPHPGRFEDVPPPHPFYFFIERMGARNIISGYLCGGPGEPCVPPANKPYFRPGAGLTRGQTAKIVAGAAGFADPIATTQQTFADVPPGNPFWLWIERLAGRGIINGYGCGGVGEPCDPANRPYFRPNGGVTRGQLTKIVSSAAGHADPVPPAQQTFADVPPAAPFWLWIERLAGRGIISGYTCGGPGEPCDPATRPYFRPNTGVTRGQAAKIVTNTFFPTC